MSQFNNFQGYHSESSLHVKAPPFNFMDSDKHREFLSTELESQYEGILTYLKSKSSEIESATNYLFIFETNISLDLDGNQITFPIRWLFNVYRNQSDELELELAISHTQCSVDAFGTIKQLQQLKKVKLGELEFITNSFVYPQTLINKASFLDEIEKTYGEVFFDKVLLSNTLVYKQLLLETITMPRNQSFDLESTLLRTAMIYLVFELNHSSNVADRLIKTNLKIGS